jgi:molecular chaperone DnaK
MDWRLAIDFGTSSTAAAMARGEVIESVPVEGLPRILSNVFWQESTHRLLLGEAAENAAALAPWCFEPCPKRRLGDEFMRLGEERVRVTEAVAAILERVAEEAVLLRGGERPGQVRLTHPVRWGTARKAKLCEAAAIAGLPEPALVLEPVAAATHYAAEALSPGEHVAVYDLGGGTFDTAVLRRTEDTFEVVGVPGGREDLGGEDFDERVYRLLGDQLPEDTWAKLRTVEVDGDGRAWSRANRELWRRARRAKELLSSNAQVDVYVPAPVERDLIVTVEQLEGLIREDIEDSVNELERTIHSGDLDPAQLTAVYLAGGSSRIPLVARLIQAQLGIAPRYLDDPKSVVALGAARAPRATAPRRATATAPRRATATATATATAHDTAVPDDPEPLGERQAAQTGATVPERTEGKHAPPNAATEQIPRPDGSGRRSAPRRQLQGVVLGAIALALAAAVVIIVATGSSNTQSGGSTNVSTSPWQPLPNLPEQEGGAGVAAYDGSIWVVGGATLANHPLNSVWVYEPAQRSWIPGPPLPVGLDSPALVVDGRDNELYALGGYSNNGGAQSTVYRLDTAARRWLAIRSLPDARTRGAAVWDGTRIVFAGGARTTGGAQDEVWALESDNWVTVGHLQQPRQHLAAASDGKGTAWFIGGYDTEPAKPGGAVDVVSGPRVTPGQSVTPIQSAAAVGLGSGFCVIGGETTGGGLRNQISCQPASQSIPALVGPSRAFLGAAILGGKLYVVGGWHLGSLNTAQAIDVSDAG